jgi:hypothetical protein
VFDVAADGKENDIKPNVDVRIEEIKQGHTLIKIFMFSQSVTEFDILYGINIEAYKNKKLSLLAGRFVTTDGKNIKPKGFCHYEEFDVNGQVTYINEAVVRIS